MAHETSIFSTIASSPITSPRCARTARTAATMPGPNNSRASESCRSVSVSPVPPKMVSWCATSPGKRTLWIGGSGAPASWVRRAVSFAVPLGAPRLPSWCSSTISARGNTRAACAAKRIISTAPNEKFGTNIAGTPASSQRSPSTTRSSSVQPVAPITTGIPASTDARATSTVTGYTVQSTTTSSSCATKSSRSSSITTLPPMPSASLRRSPPRRANAAARWRSSAASTATQATRPSLPSAPATPTRSAFIALRDHFLERRVFEHDHLLADVREVDRQQSVAAGADRVDHGPLAPFRMADLVAGVEVHAHARARVLVDRDLAPAAAARTRTDADPADRLDRRHLFDEARLRVRERVAEQRAARGEAQVQAVHRARDADVRQPALFLELGHVGERPRVREHAFFQAGEEDDRELEA